jgi:deoxyribodipyrimidine photo-lyase
VFIKRYVPELAELDRRDIHAPWNLLPIEQQACGVVLGRDYPAPIVDHEAARAKTLAMFKARG